MRSLLQHARIAGVCLEARSPLQAHLKMFVGGECLIYADPPARLKTQLNCERWVSIAEPKSMEIDFRQVVRSTVVEDGAILFENPKVIFVEACERRVERKKSLR